MYNTLPNAPGLYRLTFPSDKFYIGMTTKSMKRRLWRHVAHANAGSQTQVARAIRKYGKESITATPLIVCSDLSTLRLLEERVIKAFDAVTNGYNINPKWNHTTDTTGYCHTKKARQRIAAAQKGRVRSAETRASMAAANLGKVLSFEHRAKIALARTGTTASPETRAKMSAALLGRVVSLDTRAKISVAHRGKVLSSEHRAKISIAHRKKVIVGNILYPSYTEAAKQHGVSHSCVSRRVNSEKFKDWCHGA